MLVFHLTSPIRFHWFWFSYISLLRFVLYTQLSVKRKPPRFVSPYLLVFNDPAIEISRSFTIHGRGCNLRHCFDSLSEENWLLTKPERKIGKEIHIPNRRSKRINNREFLLIIQIRGSKEEYCVQQVLKEINGDQSIQNNQRLRDELAQSSSLFS